MTVKCDYLDVTYAPNDTPEQAVFGVIQSANAECKLTDSRGSLWFLNGGSLKIEYKRGYARFSASGAFLDGLRIAGLFMDYLSALSDSPHNVTRLDAAYDVPKDTPPILKALHRRYPRECSFTRKPLQTKRILDTRPDGKDTGTFYIGRHQQGMVTGKVYDKQWERLQAGDPLPMPLTRYELTFRRAVQATLRDAAEPDRLFWKYGETLLLKRPSDVPEWISGWGGGWHYQREETPLPAILKDRIESSSELQALAALAIRADCSEWAQQLLARTFEKHLQGPSTLEGSADAA
jgi:hypothetical protein